MTRQATLTVAGKPLTFTTQITFDLSGAELERFNNLHPRGFGGKFGHKLTKLAGVQPGDQNTRIAFPEVDDARREFDWDEPDAERPDSEFTYLNIIGPVEVDDEDDEEGGTYTDEINVKLHMTENDYKTLTQSMGLALLKEQLAKDPLDDDDPRALYTAALLAIADTEQLHFDPNDNPWNDEQHLEYGRNPDGSYRIIASDEWGDEVDMELTAAEFAALHAQLMRRMAQGPVKP
jgi:hypothetical protein